MADVTDTFYPAQSTLGFGTQWLIGNGESPEEFEAVPFVKRITPSGFQSSIIDVTHLRSPSRHREKRAGLRDTGAFSVELLWNPKHESQSNAGGGTGVFQNGGLLAWSISQEEKNMVLKSADDESPQTEMPFAGIITNYQIGEANEDGVIMLTVEVTPVRDFSAQLP